ncbi:hypothetical protein GCM10009738_34330 [Kitasatospora viridis]
MIESLLCSAGPPPTGGFGGGPLIRPRGSADYASSPPPAPAPAAESQRQLQPSSAVISVVVIAGVIQVVFVIARYLLLVIGGKERNGVG